MIVNYGSTSFESDASHHVGQLLNLVLHGPSKVVRALVPF